MAKTKGGKGKWSTESQRARLERFGIERELSASEEIIRASEREIINLENSNQNLMTCHPNLLAQNRSRLEKALLDLQAEQTKLAAFRKRVLSLKVQLDALTKHAPSELAERTRRQNALANLTIMRLTTDQAIDRALGALWRLLKERVELTRKMREAATSIDLTVGIDGLDESRFMDLTNALPDSVAERSARWVAFFLGEPQAVASYRVRDAIFTLPESLACPNAFRYGDTVKLTSEQADEVFARHPEDPSLMALNTA